MEFEFDENHDLGYGSWRCNTCDSKFFGGGRAIHNSDCTEKGYENCTYIFGPKEVEDIKKRGRSNYCSNLTLEKLSEDFPDLVK